MSRPRRSSISIHDYPEDLNPFNDGPQSTMQSSASVELRHGKEPKNKFWTFGRSKKKRSNSFSVKSAWSGLFGKRKDPASVAEIPERRTTISTVSTSYQNGKFGRPVPPPRASRDQQEFEEAFGTFTRRKKYSMENSSTYGSNLTVNGDPARLYNGSPQDTTVSILGELTPKPPARRFGQVSPRPKDDIPPLDFEVKEENRTSSPNDANRRVSEEEAPVPLRRSGRKPVPRVNVLETSEEEDREIATNLSMTDENENLSDDFVFRRCSQDAVRRSNLSINSCVSTASMYSTSGRKKRKAPQPPQRKEAAENSEDINSSSPAADLNEIPTRESIDIAKVTEDIQEMTKQSQNIDETNIVLTTATTTTTTTTTTASAEESEPTTSAEADEIVVAKIETKEKEEETKEKDNSTVEETSKVVSVNEKSNVEKGEEEPMTKDGENIPKPDCNVKEIEVVETIEINRVVEENLEIIKDIKDNSDDEDVELRKKPSKSSGLARSDSFSVKEQIEQIERQIKELESKNGNNSTNGNNNNNNKDDEGEREEEEEENSKSNTKTNSVSNSEIESKYYEPSETRLSIQANRRSFFKNMVSNDVNGVKIELKELPREQKEIQVVKLSDPPVPIPAIKEPVKIVELHISEPIKQVPEIFDDINVNPLPKPRRNSSVTSSRSTSNGNKRNTYDDSNTRAKDTKGDSL